MYIHNTTVALQTHTWKLPTALTHPQIHIMLFPLQAMNTESNLAEFPTPRTQVWYLVALTESACWLQALNSSATARDHFIRIESNQIEGKLGTRLREDRLAGWLNWRIIILWSLAQAWAWHFWRYFSAVWQTKGWPSLLLLWRHWVIMAWTWPQSRNVFVLNMAENTGLYSVCARRILTASRLLEELVEFKESIGRLAAVARVRLVFIVCLFVKFAVETKVECFLAKCLGENSVLSKFLNWNERENRPKQNNEFLRCSWEFRIPGVGRIQSQLVVSFSKSINHHRRRKAHDRAKCFPHFPLRNRNDSTRLDSTTWEFKSSQVRVRTTHSSAFRRREQLAFVLCSSKRVHQR